MTILIRCDATPETGLGHLSRCLSLAEALQTIGEDTMFVGHFGATASTLLTDAGFAAERALHGTGSSDDAEQVIALARARQASVVGDSYAFTPRWIAQLAASQHAPVLLDDFARLPDYGACAGVLNFTVSAPELRYRHLAASRLARGPQMLLVRRAIMQLRTTPIARESSVPAARVLITLGGSDVRGLTLPLAAAVRQVAPTTAVRVIHREGRALADGSGLDPEWFLPQTSDIAAQYAWADCCVAGGGLTKYECAYLGLRVGIVSQTDDQQHETDAFCARGFATDLAPVGDGRSLEDRVRAFLHDPAAPTLARAARSTFPADAPLAAARFVRQVFDAAHEPALHGLPA